MQQLFTIQLLSNSSLACPFTDDRSPAATGEFARVTQNLKQSMIPAMKDPRYTDLAKVLVHHSSEVKPGDKVLVEAFDIPTDFTVELIKTIAAAGGVPVVSTYQQQVMRAMFNAASDEQMKLI